MNDQCSNVLLPFHTSPFTASPLRKSIGTVVIDDTVLSWSVICSLASLIRSLVFLTNSILASALSAITVLPRNSPFSHAQALAFSSHFLPSVIHFIRMKDSTFMRNWLSIITSFLSIEYPRFLILSIVDTLLSMSFSIDTTNKADLSSPVITTGLRFDVSGIVFSGTSL